MPLLPERQAGTCPSGLQWYVCNSPAFTGCCSVDACNPNGCPDDSGSDASAPSSTSSPSDTPSATSDSSAATISTTSSQATSSGPATTTPATDTPLTTLTQTVTQLSTSTGPNGDMATVTSTQLTTSIESSAPSTTVNAQSSPLSADNHHSADVEIGAIIGGALGGIIVLILFGFLLRYCRKKRKFEYINATIGKKEGAKESGRGAKDIFAPFGGFRRGPQQDNDGRLRASNDSDDTATATEQLQKDREEKVPHDPPVIAVLPPKLADSPPGVTSSVHLQAELPDTSSLVSKRISEIGDGTPRTSTVSAYRPPPTPRLASENAKIITKDNVNYVVPAQYHNGSSSGNSPAMSSLGNNTPNMASNWSTPSMQDSSGFDYPSTLKIRNPNLALDERKGLLDGIEGSGPLT